MSPPAYAGGDCGSGVRGSAEIGFAVRDGATRLAHLYQHDPLRVLFPAAEPDDITLAVLVTTSGGLVAGDHVEIRARVAPDAAAHITGSAAEKIYRSTMARGGATTRVEQRLLVAAGGWLEFLPPETILFDQARLRRRTRIDLQGDGGFLGGGILVFGRRARGEHYTRGLLNERWELWRDGALAWGDALHLEDINGGDIAATIADPACFDSAAACAILILAPHGGEPGGFLGDARAVLAQGNAPDLRAGVTAVNGVLVARWLGRDPLALRRAYADLACHLRHAAMGLPPRLQRPWHT